MKDQVVEPCGITWEMLADYREGSIDAPARERLDTHMAAGCLECAGRLEWLSRAVTALAAPDLTPAPSSLQRRAKALFQERVGIKKKAAVSRPWPLIARLLLDGRGALAYARGEGEPSRSAHRVYAVASCEIDIWEETQLRGGSYVIGQALSLQADATVLTAACLEGASGEKLAAALEENEFHFTDVSSGTYTLTLEMGNETILVPGVIFGVDADGPS